MDRCSQCGGSLRILPPKGSERYGDHAGKVLVCEPYRKLVYTWNPKDKPEIARKRDSLSRVTYELTPMGPQVRLRLVHENLLPEDIEKDPNTFQGINNGWAGRLEQPQESARDGRADPLLCPLVWRQYDNRIES